MGCGFSWGIISLIVDSRSGAIWGSAHLFVEFLQTHADELVNYAMLSSSDNGAGDNSKSKPEPKCRVLELGAGTGVCGLAMARHKNVSQVVLTDCVPAVLQLLRHNICLNHSSKCIVAPCRWGHTPSVEAVIKAGGDSNTFFDLVIASDCSYDTDLCDPLFETAGTVLRLGGIFCLIHVHRERVPDAAVNAAAIRHGFEWVQVTEGRIAAWSTPRKIVEGGIEKSISIRLLILAGQSKFENKICSHPEIGRIYNECRKS